MAIISEARRRALGWQDGAEFTREQMADPEFRAGRELFDLHFALGLFGDPAEAEPPTALRAHAPVAALVDLGKPWAGFVAHEARWLVLAPPGLVHPAPRWQDEVIAFTVTPERAEPIAGLEPDAAWRTSGSFLLHFEPGQPWGAALAAINLVRG